MVETGLWTVDSYFLRLSHSVDPTRTTATKRMPFSAVAARAARALPGDDGLFRVRRGGLLEFLGDVLRLSGNLW